MPVRRELWKRRFVERFPSWPCPKCSTGTLKENKKKSLEVEHGWSLREHSHEDWEPDWIENAFSSILVCSISNCGHVVVVSGSSRVEWGWVVSDVGEQDSYSTRVLFPSAFSEAPPIFTPPEQPPSKVTRSLSQSFSAYWTNPNGCLNNLRSCVEAILDNRRIAKTTIVKSKRKRLSLHSKIRKYGQKNPSQSDTLVAIKWLGNEGSHSNDYTIDDEHLLDSYDIIEHALEEIYAEKSAVIAKKAKLIIKAKGRVKRP